MLVCPNCQAVGVYEHSVEVFPAQLAGDLEQIACYAGCKQCQVHFRRDVCGLRACEGASLDFQNTLWIAPPWLPKSLEAEFELSWDLIESFYASYAEATHNELGQLVSDLRAAGYGPRLRAGQSLSTLLFSRARNHGLNAGQSRVSVFAPSRGVLRVEGNLREVPLRYEGARSDIEPQLLASVKALAALPLE